LPARPIKAVKALRVISCQTSGNSSVMQVCCTPSLLPRFNGDLTSHCIHRKRAEPPRLFAFLWLTFFSREKGNPHALECTRGFLPSFFSKSVFRFSLADFLFS